MSDRLEELKTKPEWSEGDREWMLEQVEKMEDKRDVQVMKTLGWQMEYLKKQFSKGTPIKDIDTDEMVTQAVAALCGKTI